MKTLTSKQATALYARGLAFLEDPYQLVTRSTAYQWDPEHQMYQAIITGMKVVHRLGVRWDGQRFQRCACDHCARYPQITAAIDLIGDTP